MTVCSAPALVPKGNMQFTVSSSAIILQDQTIPTPFTPGTLAFSGNSITRGAGSFITDGWLIGDEVTVASAEDSENDGVYTVAFVSATVLTVVPPSAGVHFVGNAADTSATLNGKNRLIGGNLSVKWARIQVTSEPVRWRADGSAPTSTVGMFMAAGETLDLTDTLIDARSFLLGLQFILDTSASGDATVNVELFGEQ